MSAIVWHDQPQLNRPVLLAALSGFSDAGDVGTWSLNWLGQRLGARKLASLDAESFLIFTESRPQVFLDDAGQRQITWPEYEVSYARVPNGRDVILLTGAEPHLRWKTFSNTVLELMEKTGADTVITVGGLLGAVLHSLPARVTGTANTRDLESKLPQSTASRYQGPTGMLGVLVVAARDRGMSTASIWGQVPHYLQAKPNVKVAGALLAQIRKLLDLSFDLAEVQTQADEFTAQVDAAISRDPEAAEYVRRLGEQLQAQGFPQAQEEPDEPVSSDAIISELEDFLRNLRGPDDRERDKS